MKSAIISSST